MTPVASSPSIRPTSTFSPATSRPELAREIRRLILRESYRAKVGHIGSSLSIADLIAALYGGILNVPATRDQDRDRLVLSKGHAALALYAALHLRGWMSAEVLATYCADDSLLGVHPERELDGVDFCTGSLGQGLPMGVGAALAARLEGSARRAFVVMSDAECNEGSVWEAAMFAAHHRLANLVAMIDLNGQQAFGYTRDVVDLAPMAERWRAFGWDVHEVDGHDPDGIAQVVAGLNVHDGKPHMLVARTTFGKGVSFMENLIKWHYWPMSEHEYAIALADVER